MKEFALTVLALPRYLGLQVVHLLLGHLRLFRESLGVFPVLEDEKSHDDGHHDDSKHRSQNHGQGDITASLKIIMSTFSHLVTFTRF